MANKSQRNARQNKTVNIALICLLLAFVTPTLYGLHKHAHVSYKPHSKIQWSQPQLLDKTYSNPVSNSAWRFDFVAIETLLWKSKASVSGELYISTDTLELLQRANTLLPKDISPKERQRLNFLVTKSMPGNQGKQLAELLRQYHLYQIDYQSSLAEINRANAEQKLPLLERNALNLRSRQDKYFSAEVALKLFAEKNVTTDYLNQRRIVTMSKNLTAAQKKRQLAKLKENYKTSLEHGDRE